MMDLFRNLFGGLLLAVMLFLTSTMGTVVLVTPVLPIIFLSPTLSRRMNDFWMKLWFLLAVALYELLFGVKIVIKGWPSKRLTSSLILANHRTRLDWLFLMSYLARFSSIEEYRISLKEGLKKIPGAGWAMQAAGFLFLKRRWDLDQAHISNGLHYFSQVGSQPQFLLFPEGTDMCKNAIARSNKFAEKEGLKKYEFVLHPRTTGFVHFVKEMKKGQILDSILDVTVAYPKTLIQSELQVLQGNMPEEIHFFIQDYPLESLPTTDEGLENWVRTLWADKEERLREFYATKSFDSAVSKSDLPVNTTPYTEDFMKKKLIGVIVFWVVFMVIVFYSLFVSAMFRYFFLITALTFVIIDFRHGGIDNVIYTAVRHHEK